MVRGKQQHDEHYYAESGEKDIHPVLAQKVDSVAGDLFFMMMVSMFAGLCMYMALMTMVMSCMRRMVMAETAGGQCGNEYRQSCKHQHPLPSVVTFLIFSVFVFRPRSCSIVVAFRCMYDVSVMTFGLCSAVRMVMLVAFL